MTVCSILGIGLYAPGLESFAQAAPILRGDRAYTHTPLPPPQPLCLPRNERRRTTATIRLALTAARQALDTAACNPAALATVFASSSGDMPLVDAICSTLASTDRALSPTHFHNSVHNAPAGYWSIAMDAHAPSASLGAYDASFAAGLLEAATLCVAENRGVLLVAYEQAMAQPFDTVRPIGADCAVALVLAAPREDAPTIDLELTTDTPTPCADHALEALRTDNPAARALPLLAALAGDTPTRLVLPYLDADSGIAVTYTPAQVPCTP
ncbi:beta-ketoacyl synthase chain length factor [Acidihalobacter ferrooxydans]|uniref:Beta-ketoacyl synthase-like N-terminal domain-containing protein n=1 Tax=Acidihalobacter ferrooxydans TaxID=1765967 RepID=A0A1P8UE24_9GAMM|nr:beta-ketoacyl synthase chain length factor [Acidihalobacter ferrooxydans]APZ42056.1 hypothetical protein BW247_02220 [Acidihalobacter ferrooxydans]